MNLNITFVELLKNRKQKNKKQKIHMLIFVSTQVFYPKETFNSPLILDLIFRQVNYTVIYCIIVLSQKKLVCVYFSSS